MRKLKKYLFGVKKEFITQIFFNHSLFGDNCSSCFENAFFIKDNDLDNATYNLQCPVCNYDFYIASTSVDIDHPKILTAV
jgi:hypothetical protein